MWSTTPPSACFAAHLSATAKGRDAVEALRCAIARAKELLCDELTGDCVDTTTGELARLRVVTDNGAAFKSGAFWRFANGHPHLEHIRTRHYAPQTNGVVERVHQSLKYKHLYQREIEQAATMAEEIHGFLVMFNEVRPHEALGYRLPLEMHLLDPHLFEALTLQDP